MENKELCTVRKDKLYKLVNKVIALYQIIDDHCMLMATAVKHFDQLRKSDMRDLSEALLFESQDIFESIGCPHNALLEDDEDELFQGIVEELEVCGNVGEQDTMEKKVYLEEVIQALTELLSSDKPITVSADIHINESEEDDERR